MFRRTIVSFIRRSYGKDYVVMPRKEGHWVDPKAAVKRIMNIFSAHESVDVSKLTPVANFKQDLKLHDLDVVELLLEVEKDFFMEFNDDIAERFKNIEEIAEHIGHWPFADNY